MAVKLTPADRNAASEVLLKQLDDVRRDGTEKEQRELICIGFAVTALLSIDARLESMSRRDY